MRYGKDFNPLGITIPEDLSLREPRLENGMTRTAKNAFVIMFNTAGRCGIEIGDPIPLDIQDDAWEDAMGRRDDGYINEVTTQGRFNARRRAQDMPLVDWST